MKNMNLEQKKETGNPFWCVDICKFVLAIFVVSIHYPPFLEVGGGIHRNFRALGSLAVPFFFVVSGFFYARRGYQEKDNYHGYCRKMLGLYVPWKILSLLLFQVPQWLEGNAGRDVWDTLLHIVKNTEYGPLWYLTGCVIAVSIIYFLRLSPKQIVILGTAAYVFGAMEDAYFDFCSKWDNPISHMLVLIKNAYGNTNTGYTFGLFFIGMGIIMFTRGPVKMSMRRLSLALVFSFSLLFLETWMLGRNGTILISLVPITYFGVSLVLAICDRPVNATVCAVSRFIRKISIYIYVTHDIIGKLWFSEYNAAPGFFYVALSSTLAASVIVLIQDKIRGVFLRNKEL